ncbi:hypothetical protein M413DRAFT_9087 [Hebeloma cylindrosporum]|uniref:Uncharacterized protein n=1 Tax=Hebeloma cylindrosporum TaxID=76867 RepID=A0A0C3C7G3_HEBCY|nr:hypothetical protein M413DRAFT_9087 [Hebeloma cylindrosporum h7]
MNVEALYVAHPLKDGGRTDPDQTSSNGPSHKTAYHPKSQLKHTVSLSSLEPLKDGLESKLKPKAKPRKKKSMAQLLASPFVSRASSPVATHIPTSQANQDPGIRFSNPKKRTALAETSFDSNLPADSRPTSRSRSHHPNSLAYVPQHILPERRNNDDAHKSSKSRPSANAEHLDNARRRHTRGGENSNPLKRDLAEGQLSRKKNQDRERRPSAPSSLLRPRPLPLPFRVPVTEDIPKSNANLNKYGLTSGLNVFLGPSIHHSDNAGLAAHQQKTTAKLDPEVPSTKTQAIIPHPVPLAHQKRQTNANDEDSDAGMAWMHRRSGVNFDRPPSQMEFFGSAGGISGLGFGIGLDDPVFTSDDDDDGSSDEAVIPMVTKGRVGARLDLGLELDGGGFGEDAWGISTPLKGGDIQNDRKKQEDQQSQQLQRGQGLAGRLTSHLPPKSQLGLKANDDEEDEGQDQEEMPDNGSGEDMDLTASATFGYLEVIAAGATDRHGNSDEGDITPWITDSLISPPTVYLEKKKRDGRDGNTPADEINAGQGDDQEGKTTLGSTTRLSSPFRLTSPTGLSTPFTEMTNDQQDESENQAVIVKQFNQDTAGSTKVTNATTNKNPTRTRSGTIVPANPMPPGARRTRSGTIVGPLAAPPAPPPSNKICVGSTRRTRSGTIVANSSSVTGPQAPGESGPVSQPDRVGRASGSLLKMKDRRVQPRPTSEEDGNDDRGTATTNKDLLARDTSTNDPEFEFDADSESEDAVECFADSLYVPRRTSAPDPIDFLRFASIEEGDDEVEHLPMEFATGAEERAMRWCVAEEPPSPEVQKRRGRGGRFGLFGGILGGRGHGKRGGKKVSKNLKTRFVGVQHGEEEEDTTQLQKEQEMEMEDDELLLRPGESASLWI